MNIDGAPAARARVHRLFVQHVNISYQLRLFIYGRVNNRKVRCKRGQKPTNVGGVNKWISQLFITILNAYSKLASNYRQLQPIVH